MAAFTETGDGQPGPAELSGQIAVGQAEGLGVRVRVRVRVWVRVRVRVERGRAVEEGGEEREVDGGRHDHQPQLRPARKEEWCVVSRQEDVP